MAQKVALDQKSTPAAARFEEIVREVPENLPSGIRPYIEDPEKVIRRSIRNSILIIIFVVLLTGGLIFYATINIIKKSEELQNSQNLIYLTSKQAEVGSKLISQYEQISPNIAKIEAALPSANDLLGYMGALDNLAKQVQVDQNVKIQSLPTGQKPANLPGQEQTKVAPASVEHVLELKGNLEKFTNYLAGLEKLPYFVNITSFTLSGTPGLDKDATASFTANIYTSSEQTKKESGL